MWCMGLVRDTVTPVSPSSRQMSRVARVGQRVARGNQQTHPPSYLSTFCFTTTTLLHRSTFCLTTTSLLPTILVLRRPPAGGSWRNQRGHTLSDDCCYIRLAFWSHFGLGFNQKEAARELQQQILPKSRHPILTNFISGTTFEINPL